ncbi:unnamed protein product, partial [Rotaria magnacalcarata]
MPTKTPPHPAGKISELSRTVYLNNCLFLFAANHHTDGHSTIRNLWTRLVAFSLAPRVERYNSIKDSKIAALSNLRKTDWDDQLPFVTFNYNTSIHSSTKQIPFEMIYGRTPILPIDYQDNVTISYDDKHIKKLNQFFQKLNEQAKINIITNQERYKQRYDTNRSDPAYDIGDLVLIKTNNTRYRFDICYEGPYRIIKKLTPKTFIIQHIKKPTLYRQ